MELWGSLRNNFSEFNLFVYGIFFTNFVTFWTLNGVFLYADIKKSLWWKQFKIQDNNPTTERIKKELKMVATNQMLSLLFIYLTYFLIDNKSCFTSILPSYKRCLLDIFLSSIILEIMFYSCHRLLHTKYLYSKIHKRHHEWMSPIGITSFYAHPIELICANILPAMIGPILLKSHFITFIIWTTMAITSVVISHSGYHLPLWFSTEAHDYHHLKFNESFGVLGIMDYICGTDRRFRLSKKYLLHKIFLDMSYPIQKKILM
jgi:fatty acid hydroxylase domain-containing protein 2